MIQTSQYPLHDMVINQDFTTKEIIEQLSELLNSHCDINTLNNDCKTTLNLAVEYKSHPEIIQFLIDRHADVNIPDLFNTTPLYNAIMYDSIESAIILLHHGADISFKNDEGKTPVDIAHSPKTKALFENN